MMRRHGFTLIELVMVIVIIGILAAVAIPRFMDLQNEARIARCQSDVGAIRTGLSGWYAKYWANSSQCPSLMYGGVAGDCNASGFPAANQLVTNNSQFAQFAFSDGLLPNTTHIMNTSACGTWGAVNCYSPVTGVVNQTQACGS